MGGGEINELVRSRYEAAKKAAPRWAKLRDDADALLWIMGGYAWAAAAGEGEAEEFCRENRVNPRQISEAHSLMQQLGDILKRRLSLQAIGIDLELPLQPRPPSAAPAQKLRECVM